MPEITYTVHVIQICVSAVAKKVSNCLNDCQILYAETLLFVLICVAVVDCGMWYI